MTGDDTQDKNVSTLPTRRNLSDREFNALPPSERLQAVNSASGKRKYQLLLAAADAAELVPLLPAQEIYLLLRDLGPEDVAELVALSSTEQLTTFLDLDCWQEDLLDGRAALGWLSLLLDTSEEKVAVTATELEFELLQLMVGKWLRVLSGPEQIEDEDARIEAMSRNGGYVIEYVDAETGKLAERLLDILWRHERELYLRLLEGVRQELDSQLEEEVYQWRRGRLLDHGFADPHQARSIYAWLDPESFRSEDHLRQGAVAELMGTEAPGFVLSEVRPKRLLAEVLAGGISREAAWELTFLLNKLMSADQVDVGELAQVRASLERLYAFLNLGLERLCGNDAARAAELFESLYPEALFRLGFSLTLRLQRRAGALKGSRLRRFLDLPFSALVEALLQPRPEFLLDLAEPGRGGTRPFSSMEEVRLAELRLDLLDVQRELFEKHFPFGLPAEDLDLDGCQPEGLEELTLSRLFLTALANRLLGRAFAPEPVPAGELAKLQEVACRGGRVADELRRETCAWLESLVPGGERFGAWCLESWDEGLCALAPEDLDPRFIDGLIVRL